MSGYQGDDDDQELCVVDGVATVALLRLHWALTRQAQLLTVHYHCQPGQARQLSYLARLTTQCRLSSLILPSNTKGESFSHSL